MNEVTLIARIDSLASIDRELHIEASVDKLSNGRIKAKSFNSAALECEHKLGGRRVGTVSSADAFSSRTKQIVHRSILFLVDRENSSNRDIAVNVGRTIERVECNTELSSLVGGNNNWFLILLGHKNAADTAVHQCIDHHIVGHDIKLFLVISSRVHFTSETIKLSHTSTSNSGGNKFEGSGEGVQKKNKFGILCVVHNISVKSGGIDVKFKRHCSSSDRINEG
mmetsp:Transcript_20060/g.29753  ORF Transcript_20060/g.29753 Transcript_20060/m.29753 type:complete len:224 (+) Transcript_20060:612-1283(+)